MKRISIFLVTLFFLFSGVIFASTMIELKSGQKVEGELIEETADYIRLNVMGVELTFYKDEIKGREEKKPFPKPVIKTEAPAVDHKAAPDLSVKKVYAAYQAAVQSSDIKGLRKHVSSQAMAELDAVEDAAMALNLMKKMSPKNVKIIDEKIDGETATLTATAEGMFGSSRGEISFVKQEGVWKLVKENWKAGRSIETRAGESKNLKPPVDMPVNDNAVGGAVDNAPVSTKQIIPKTTGMVIDGQAGDWAGVTVLIADGEGDVRESFMGEPAYEFDVTDVKMALGEKDLYVLIKFAQPILEVCEKNGRKKPGEAHAKTVAAIFVDADNNKATGGEEFFSKRSGFECKIEVWSGVARADGSMSVSGGSYMTDVDPGAVLEYFLEAIPSRFNAAENELRTDFAQKLKSNEDFEYVAFVGNVLEMRIPFKKIGTGMSNAKAVRVLLSEDGSGLGEESFSKEVVAQVQ